MPAGGYKTEPAPEHHPLQEAVAGALKSLGGLLSHIHLGRGEPTPPPRTAADIERDRKAAHYAQHYR